MKIFISVDLEGLNGVSRFSQVENKATKDYEKVIIQLHKEVNAVIEGGFKAGAKIITVNDAHSSMINLNINELDDRAELVTGKPKNFSMMSGLDSSYTAAILLGYHSKASTLGGCLAHTFSEDFTEVKINGIAIGESYINSAYAATLGVPIALIAGDETLKKEIYDQIGDVPFVISKQALGYNAVKSRPNNLYLHELEDKTVESLNNPTNWILNKQEGPYELEIEFSKVVMADLVELIPGTNRIEVRRIKYSHMSFETIYKTLQAICVISGSSKQYY